jgi:hypothetical protein
LEQIVLRANSTDLWLWIPNLPLRGNPE